MNKALKELIDKYCMGIQPTDAQMDEIMDMVAETGADFKEAHSYITEMQNGPTLEERIAAEEARKKAQEEAERKAKEERERKAKEKAEKKAQEEAERKAKEERERKAKERAEKKAQEEAEQKTKERKTKNTGHRAKGKTGNKYKTIPENKKHRGGCMASTYDNNVKENLKKNFEYEADE